jgi:hypothetical protein
MPNAAGKSFWTLLRESADPPCGRESRPAVDHKALVLFGRLRLRGG